MQTEEYESPGPYARKIQEATEAGWAKGMAKGMAKAVLRRLDFAGVALTDEQRETIGACTDLEQLDTWIDRSVKATSARDVFMP
ncbi:hypothetical protein GCM10027570_56050 [Streptomonospora sediminis]